MPGQVIQLSAKNLRTLAGVWAIAILFALSAHAEDISASGQGRNAGKEYACSEARYNAMMELRRQAIPKGLPTNKIQYGDCTCQPEPGFVSCEVEATIYDPTASQISTDIYLRDENTAPPVKLEDVCDLNRPIGGCEAKIRYENIRVVDKKRNHQTAEVVYTSTAPYPYCSRIYYRVDGAPDIYVLRHQNAARESAWSGNYTFSFASAKIEIEKCESFGSAAKKEDQPQRPPDGDAPSRDQAGSGAGKHAGGSLDRLLDDDMSSEGQAGPGSGKHARNSLDRLLDDDLSSEGQAGPGSGKHAKNSLDRLMQQEQQEEERQRQAEAEAERQAEAEAERQRQAEAEAERQRQAEAEAERQRQAQAEAERQRQAEAEAERQANSASGGGVFGTILGIVAGARILKDTGNANLAGQVGSAFMDKKDRDQFKEAINLQAQANRNSNAGAVPGGYGGSRAAGGGKPCAQEDQALTARINAILNAGYGGNAADVCQMSTRVVSEYQNAIPVFQRCDTTGTAVPALQNEIARWEPTRNSACQMVSPNRAPAYQTQQNQNSRPLQYQQQQTSGGGNQGKRHSCEDNIGPGAC